jgi:hypothetical protein
MDATSRHAASFHCLTKELRPDLDQRYAARNSTVTKIVLM